MRRKCTNVRQLTKYQSTNTEALFHSTAQHVYFKNQLCSLGGTYVAATSLRGDYSSCWAQDHQRRKQDFCSYYHSKSCQKTGDGTEYKNWPHQLVYCRRRRTAFPRRPLVTISEYAVTADGLNYGNARHWQGLRLNSFINRLVKFHCIYQMSILSIRYPYPELIIDILTPKLSSRRRMHLVSASMVISLKTETITVSTNQVMWLTAMKKHPKKSKSGMDLNPLSQHPLQHYC